MTTERFHTVTRSLPTQLALCVLVALASILLWEGFIDGPDQALAQSRKPTLATSEALSSTTLLQDLTKAQKETNAKLDEMIALFKTGKAKVAIVTDDAPEPASKTETAR